MLNHKVIFGMKLRRFREQAGLSLTDLGIRTRLSTSYLTEIKHGKKYPKAEKIARMAKALGRNYDDLVSIRLDEQLSPLSGFLESPVLHNFPFHMFGISPARVVELMTQQPLEASALVNALIGIAEQYNIGIEHLYRSALRSYQELHENYFPDIERAEARSLPAGADRKAPVPSAASIQNPSKPPTSSMRALVTNATSGARTVSGFASMKYPSRGFLRRSTAVNNSIAVLTIPGLQPVCGSLI